MGDAGAGQISQPAMLLALPLPPPSLFLSQEPSAPAVTFAPSAAPGFLHYPTRQSRGREMLRWRTPSLKGEG